MDLDCFVTYKTMDLDCFVTYKTMDLEHISKSIVE